MTQFCPLVSLEVSQRKCNRCNKELVGRTRFCCKYINCLTVCDYREKETCKEYLAKVAEKMAKTRN